MSAAAWARDRRTLAGLVVAAAGLAVAHLQNRPLVESRVRADIFEDPLGHTPPLVSLTTVALGGFRGLIADMLWVRSARLQEEGKYFELVQLADWITKLEPRHAAVWRYHAWNLAYNVSVFFSDPADRWRWVENGIQLLRDEGLRYNPEDAPMYFELAFIFQHKLGEKLDEAYPYYRNRLADEMTRLGLGFAMDFDRLAGDADARDALRTRLRLDVGRMREIDARYGPLDWRTPWPQAIYWAHQGLPLADSFHERALNRIINQCLMRMVQEGTAVRRDDGTWTYEPNLALAPVLVRRMQEVAARYPDEMPFLHAKVGNLEEVIALTGVWGDWATARMAHDALREAMGITEEEPPEVFAALALMARVDDPSSARVVTLVLGALVQAEQWRARAQFVRAMRWEAAAQAWYEAFDARLVSESARRRLSAPPLDELRARARHHVREGQASGFPFRTDVDLLELMAVFAEAGPPPSPAP